MAFVRNYWYGAIWSANLGDKPVGLRILNKPIVLFRTAKGAVAVLDDVCPHRFVPLHLGTVVGGERLRCGYHGLEFDAAGACVHNPHTNRRIPPAAKVKSYTATERNGMVWVWLGDRPAKPDLIPDFAILDDPRYIPSGPPFTIIMKANYQLIVNNLLDLSHANILHEGTLGNAAMDDAEITIEHMNDGFVIKRLSRNILAPRLFELLCDANGRRVDAWVNMRVMGVSALLNDSGATKPGAGRDSGSGLLGVNIVTPVDEETSLYHVTGVLVNPPKRSPEDSAAVGEEATRLADYAFNMQDKVVLEAQQAVASDTSVDTSRPALFDVDIAASHYARRLKALQEADQVA